MGSRLLFLSFMLLLASASIMAQATDMTYNAGEVVVTSGRIPSSFSNLTRSVTVIDSRQLKEIPAGSLQDVLNYIGGVDLRKRGPEGVQADVSIRGGSFEQTLILVDGVRLSDPQTGHHNLNLPVSLQNVERIEVLKGPGSKSYGANAFAGVINIITKKGKEGSAGLNLSGGQYGFYNGELSLSLPFLSMGNRLSASRSRSDGYRHNTQFSQYNLSYAANMEFDHGSLNASAGYTDKEFGANGFYSNRYPDQWEQTKTTFASLSADYGGEAVTVSPKAYWRKNTDDYILDSKRPEWYHNRHKTYTYGTELQVLAKSFLGSTVLGGEFNRDEIKSSSLGDHKRDKGGLFFEHRIELLERLNISAGGFAYSYGSYGWRFWPGFDAAYKFTPNLRAYVSAGRSFRIPTYTDLYYKSPAQVGNSQLKPEEAVTYEGGVSYGATGFAANLSAFTRRGSNMIDWVLEPQTNIWKARNLISINAHGVEAGITLFPSSFSPFLFIDKLDASYTWIESDKLSGGEQSKYILDHLRHQAIVRLSYDIIPGLNNYWTMRYEARMNLEEHFVADTRLGYRFSLAEVYLEATNIFDRKYMDIGGVTMPGRWIRAGVSLSSEF